MKLEKLILQEKDHITRLSLLVINLDTLGAIKFLSEVSIELLKVRDTKIADLNHLKEIHEKMEVFYFQHSKEAIQFKKQLLTRINAAIQSDEIVGEECIDLMKEAKTWGDLVRIEFMLTKFDPKEELEELKEEIRELEEEKKQDLLEDVHELKYKCYQLINRIEWNSPSLVGKFRKEMNEILALGDDKADTKKLYSLYKKMDSLPSSRVDNEYFNYHRKSGCF